jgi:hypothetical protein
MDCVARGFRQDKCCCCCCRADWKACTYSGDEEKVAAEGFREYFKPFDIMQTE